MTLYHERKACMLVVWGLSLGSRMLSKPFLTTQEIADLLKVREQTVRGWIHQQELRAVKLGREFRVAVKDLEAFVNDHATREPSWQDDSGSQQP